MKLYCNTCINRFLALCLIWSPAILSSRTAAAEEELELIYFNAPGRAEPIRIMLHAAGIEFTDTRIRGQDWPAIKPMTPLGFVPILKLGDRQYCQSAALMRYAAKKSCFYPTNDLEALVVDEIMDSINELMSKAPRSKDQAEMMKLRKEFQDTTMVQYATYFEAKIAANEESSFVVGHSLTMVDLALQGLVQAVQIGMWDYIDEDFFNSYPAIIALAKAVEDDGIVKEYYASRASSTGDEL